MELLLLAGICSLTRLRTFGAVFGAATTTFINAKAVQSTANNVVTHTWQVFHTTATHKNNGVLLEVVAFTADVGNNFMPVGEADFGNLTQRRVGLLRGAGHHLQANTTALRTVSERWGLRFDRFVFAAMSHELVDGGHEWDVKDSRFAPVRETERHATLG